MTPKQVAAARRALGWTRAELARRAGVDHNVVQRVERGGKTRLGYLIVEALQRSNGKLSWQPIAEAPRRGTYWLLFSYQGGPAWAGEWSETCLGKRSPTSRWWGPLPYPTSFMYIPEGAF